MPNYMTDTCKEVKLLLASASMNDSQSSSSLIMTSLYIEQLAVNALDDRQSILQLGTHFVAHLTPYCLKTVSFHFVQKKSQNKYTAHLTIDVKLYS